MLPFLPLLPMLLAGTAATMAYGEYQRKRGQNSANNSSVPAVTKDNTTKEKVQTIYNYNGFDDSTLGRTLFNSSGTDQNKVLAGRNKTLFS